MSMSMENLIRDAIERQTEVLLRVEQQLAFQSAWMARHENQH